MTATYGELTESLILRTWSFSTFSEAVAQYVTNPPNTLTQGWPWTMTTSPGKFADSCATTVITESLEDIETRSFYE